MNQMVPPVLVAQPQLELQFDPPEHAHDFAYYVAIGNVFQAHHHRWPTLESTAAEFVEAHIHGYDGRQLDRELRNPCRELEEDEAYQQLSIRCLVDGIGRIGLGALDPEYRNTLPAAAKDQLLDTITLPGLSAAERSRVGGGAPREPGELWLSLPQTVRLEALARAGYDADDHSVRVNSSNVRIHATPDLKAYMDRIGMIYPTDDATIAEHYFLEITEMDRLSICYQSLGRHRFAGDINRDSLISKLSAVFAADPLLKKSAKAVYSPEPAVADIASPAVQPAIVDSELQEQIARLVHEGQSLRLPQENLTRYADIKRAIEKAGGKYRTSKKQFDFAVGIDPAEVLERLVGGDKINFKKQFQFFSTNAEQARRVCLDAGPLEGMRVLEPSAGDGAIADVAREMGADLVTIELWNVNAHKLRAKGYDPIERDFLSVSPDEIGTFDAIIANPPFTKGQDIAHFMKMTEFLRPGGSMSVIMSTSWLNGDQAKQVAFRDFLASHGGKIERLEADAFSHAGTNFPTARVTLRDFTPVLESTPETTVRRRRMQ